MRKMCVILALLASVLCGVCSEDGGIAEKLSSSAEMTETLERREYSEKWGWGMYGCTTAYLNTSYTDEDGVFQTEYKELAKYGECIENDAYGLLVHVTSLQKSSGPNQEEVEDHTGCRMPLVEGPIPTEPWIALIKRGGCNFQNKVENAYNSNASAVIVYDDRQSLNLQKMRLSSATRNISAVFTYKWKGENLAQLLEAKYKVYIGIAVGNPCDRPYNLNRTSVLFVSVSFIVLLVISLAWLIFYYVQRFRYIHAKDRLSRRLCSAAKKALSKIPTKNIKAEDKELQGDGECCAICIEPFKVSDILRLLPCKHAFHKSCIDPWLLDQRTCPMCKMDILKHYGFVFTGSQESILHLEVEEGNADNLDSRTTSPIPQPLTPEPEEITVRALQVILPQAGSIHQRSADVNDPETVSPSSTKLEFEQEMSSPTPDAVLPRQETDGTKK